MGYRILIADDEPEIRDLLRLYLENEHYEVIEAQDGQQALELLRSETPDMCVLDIMMPKMDGYHVLQELRKESNIPVLILSAKDADSEKILGLNLGADDYLAKPFNPLEAVARVNSNIRRFYALGTQDVGHDELTVRDLTLNPESCTLKKAERVIDHRSNTGSWSFSCSIRARCLRSSRSMSRDGAKLILLQIIILWSVSVSCVRSLTRIRRHISAQSVVLDTGWRSR